MDPLFMMDNGEPLSCVVFVSTLKNILTLANFDATKFSGHSFHSGAATSPGEATLKHWRDGTLILIYATLKHLMEYKAGTACYVNMGRGDEAS